MRFALFLSLSVLMFSCAQQESTDQNTDASAQKKEVNVYTHRHYDVDQDIFNRFEEQTGIKVNVVKASADELIVRLENEAEKSPADLLVTVDAGRLVMAQQKGLLQPVKSEILESSIPPHLRDPEGHWFGQTVRARLLVYSKNRVKPEELTSFEDLTNEQWKERILVRSSSNIYNQSLLASIIANNGEEAAEAWAGGMVANFARSPKGNDRDQVIGIAAGQGDVAIVNSYYIGKMYDSEDEGERAAVDEIAVFFPNQEGRGTHINISGAGVTTHAPNRENAVKLLEFMATPEIQKIFAEANHEYPVHPDAEVSDLLKSWGEFKQDTLNLKLLGEYNSKGVEIFDRAGWK